jgi:4'-phosphopantetheinyl transferase
MRFEKRRSDWLLGRWTAKCLVGQTLVCGGLKAAVCGAEAPRRLKPAPQSTSIEIHPSKTGAPEVYVDAEAFPISISISHRDGTALCAVGEWGTWLGCDLESMEPRSNAFRADYFHADEHGPPSLLWSAKESALKALRIGLGVDMRRLLVSLVDAPETGGWRPLTVQYAHLRTFHGWWRQSGGLIRTVAAAPAPGVPVLCASS